MKQLASLLFIIATLAPPLAFAEDRIADVTDMQALRAAVRADKRGFVESTLKLTDAEAKRFWPIYDTYQRNLDVTNRRRVVAIQEILFRDKPMTNRAAKFYATELLALDEAEIKARRTMRNRVMRALPAIKAARYLQLENKIRAVEDYDVAATVPLTR